jgi:cobyrinic acid a,c-diamide synthase
MTSGLVIAAPGSGSGKTTLTLALLRHFARSGVRVASMKVGPDYIDPAFHCAASGRPCYNVDLWGMRAPTVQGVVDCASRDADLIIAEGVMGLFDGAVTDEGSTADVAAHTGWPVILVVDAQGMAASAAAVVRGFATHRDDVEIAGVIFNRIGSDRHRDILRACIEPLGIPMLGALRRNGTLELPGRHLGLVQAGELEGLSTFLDAAADAVSVEVDTNALQQLARPVGNAHRNSGGAIPPLGKRIAVATDIAFGFCYPYVLERWRACGASIHPFSPLANEGPSPDADAVFLPGGYPELHASTLAANSRFLSGLHDAVNRGATIFGECGGYMVLGETLTDAQGSTHRMAGLLPVTTSFERPKLHLGYRDVQLTEHGQAGPMAHCGTKFRGHEFHYASVVASGSDKSLFDCRSARGEHLGLSGHVNGNVAGSFIHLIDAVDLTP